MRPKKCGKRISTMGVCVLCIIRFYQIYHLISIQHYLWGKFFEFRHKAQNNTALLDQFDFVYNCLFVYKYI